MIDSRVSVTPEALLELEATGPETPWIVPLWEIVFLRSLTTDIREGS